MTVDTAGMGLKPTEAAVESKDDLYPKGIPEPTGTNLDEKLRASKSENTDPTSGTGVEGEIEVWQARYSERNFIGRIAVRVVLTVAVAALVVYTWGMDHTNLRIVTWASVAVMALIWIALGFRMIQAYYSHFYRLTNRRLFVSIGITNRRIDMMELLRVKDVFTRQQSLLERWLNLGTVVVVPGEKELPTFYLSGVNQPRQVMDLIWHQARAERDQRSLKVEDL